MNRVNSFILALIFIGLSGCALKPGHYNETELNSDLVYNNIDKRWYHSTPPRSREMMSFDRPADD